MWSSAFLGNRQAFDPPTASAALLFLIRLIKTTVSCNKIGTLTRIGFDAIDHLADGFGVADIVLIFRVRQDDAVIIHRQAHQTAKLARLVGFALFDALFDDRHFRLVHSVQSLSGFLAIEHFTSLLDHLLADRYQPVKAAAGLLVAPGIQRI